MHYARENLTVSGELYWHQSRFHPDDYFWRGSSSTQLSHEFINWQRYGSPAILVSSIAVTDLPRHEATYCIRAESHGIVSFADKSFCRNKQLYYATARVSADLPFLHSSNSFLLPVTLSSPQSEFSVVVDVIPYYVPSLISVGREGEVQAPSIYRRFNREYDRDREEEHLSRRSGVDGCVGSTTKPTNVAGSTPRFELTASFLRMSNVHPTVGVQ